MSSEIKGRAVRTITEIVDYLPGRSGIDSDQMTTPHELGIDGAPIVVFDTHLRMDLARIVDRVGCIDSSEVIVNCVNFMAKLVEDTAQGATPQLDFPQVVRALVGEEESEAEPLL